MNKGLLAIISTFIIALWGVVTYFPQLVDPGHLTKGHAKIQEKCFVCHKPLLGVDGEKCLSCHPLDKIGRNKPGKVAFHQGLQQKDCGACHSDHQGESGGSTTRRFDHALLKEGEGGGCAGCHVAPKDSMHGAAGKVCSQCHTNQKWRPATLVHDRYFRFDRHHPASGCTSCHANSQWKSYSCYGCHEHSEGKVRKKHLKEGIRQFDKCVSCHRSGDEHEAKRIWRQEQGGERRSEGGEKNHRKKEHHDDDDD